MQSLKSPEFHEERSHGVHSFRCAFYIADPLASSFHAQLHWHDELEILFFQKGDFSLDINMEHYRICQECLFFVNAGELHQIRCEQPCREFALVFSPHLLSSLSNDEAQSRVISPLIRQEILLPRMLTPQMDGYREVLDEFLRLSRHMAVRDSDAGSMEATSAATQLFVRAGILNILAWLSAYGLLGASRPAQREDLTSVKAVLSFIHSHYSERISVSDLAGLLSLNTQYFCRFFKKATGKSPMAYVNEYRIRQAISLLESTSMPVMEICLECGFNNFGNFLREFRSQTGMTPQKYRKQQEGQGPKVPLKKSI